VDVEEFEPEILDSLQDAVQGRLVGSGAPHYRRIARRAMATPAKAVRTAEPATPRTVIT
jgi:hypothetical protein